VEVTERPEQAGEAATAAAPPDSGRAPLPPFPPAADDPNPPQRADVTLGRQLAAGAAPDSRPAAWMWLVFAGLGFLGGQVLAALLAVVAAALSGDLHSLSTIATLNEPPTWYIVSTLCGLWGGFAGSAWLASSLRGTGSVVRDLGLRFRWIDLIGVPIGIGGQVLVALVYVPIASHVHNFSQRFDAPSQRLTGGSHGAAYAVIVVCTVIGAPFFEELFFRGVLLRSLARLFGNVGGWVGPALAVVVSGVLFGLAHAESLQLLGLALFGVILGLVSWRTGRLGMNMVAHATFNLMALVAVITPATVGLRFLI